MRGHSRWIANALAIAGSALLLAGCEITIGSTGSEPEVSDGAGMSALMIEQLTEMSGVRPTSLTCPEELVHEEGRRYECTVVHPTEGEQIIDVTMRAPTGFGWLVRG